MFLGFFWDTVNGIMAEDFCVKKLHAAVNVGGGAIESEPVLRAYFRGERQRLNCEVRGMDGVPPGGKNTPVAAFDDGARRQPAEVPQHPGVSRVDSIDVSS